MQLGQTSRAGLSLCQSDVNYNGNWMKVFKGLPHWPTDAFDFGGRGADRKGEEGTLGSSRSGDNPCIYLLWRAHRVSRHTGFILSQWFMNQGGIGEKKSKEGEG